MTTLVFFPEEFINLQKELQHHPELVAKLQQYAQKDGQAEMIAEIAAHCDVVMDGVYDHNALVQLAGILAQKLYERRPGEKPQIILPFGYH